MRLRLIAVAAALAALSACGGNGRSESGSEAAIATFDVSPSRVSASFAAVDQLALRDPAGLRSAALAKISSPDPDVRYAVVYALSLTATKGESLDALVRVLGSRDVTERILAAETLTAQQDKRGVPVLIAALASNAFFAHWSPPRRAREEARRALLRFVPAGARLRSAGRGAWRRWWSHHGSAVRLRPHRIGAP